MYRPKKLESSETSQVRYPTSPPNSAWILAEARAGLDVASVPLSLMRSWLGKVTTSSSSAKESSKLPIILLPGFASDEELGSKVVLIGWSLGGFIAREVARDLGDEVAHVITLGSPVIGGPKYTKAVKFFEAKGFNLEWIEREAVKRDAVPIQQPITAIYSKTDGIVAWRSAIDKISPNVTHWQINAPHLGMGFNAKVWTLIRQSLVQYGQVSH